MWITLINVRKNSLSTCGQTVYKKYVVINIIQFYPEPANILVINVKEMIALF